MSEKSHYNISFHEISKCEQTVSFLCKLPLAGGRAGISENNKDPELAFTLLAGNKHPVHNPAAAALRPHLGLVSRDPPQ